MINTAKAKNYSHMHWLVLLVSILFFVSALILFKVRDSSADPNFNSGKEVNASTCKPEGTLVINVTEKVLHTVDSGEGGNNWAFDDLNRKIQVWKTSDNTYCALIQNEGKFDSQEGEKSPGNTGTLTGKEDGTFKGGYRAKITGAMLPNPTWPTKGSVGTHDYQCNIDGVCTGYINWIKEYFSPNYIFSYEWWGWTYQYKNKTWVNSSDGNSGDII